jgi:DNA-binding response OmpR family regulator
LGVVLRACGHDVKDAADGLAALDAIRSDAPDLVLLDWRMPGLDGIQTCRAVRANFSVPVILVSSGRSSAREEALTAGANDYLAKPFSLADLLTHIELVLRSSNGRA